MVSNCGDAEPQNLAPVCACQGIVATGVPAIPLPRGALGLVRAGPGTSTKSNTGARVVGSA